MFISGHKNVYYELEPTTSSVKSVSKLFNIQTEAFC